MKFIRSFTKDLVWLLYGDSFLLRVYERQAISRLLQVQGPAKLLDVGAGELGLTIWLRRRSPQIQLTACDMHFSAVSTARAKAAGICLVVTDGTWIPATENGYKRILLSSVLQMVPDPHQLLLSCRQVLDVENGRIILSVPAPYHFIERLFSSKHSMAKPLRAFFKLPPTAEEYYRSMWRRFGVDGPKGCYTRSELEQLLGSAGFTVVEHRRSPGWFGTLVWEGSLLLSQRFGPAAYLLMGPFYPVVLLCDKLWPQSKAGEHLIAATVTQSREKM